MKTLLAELREFLTGAQTRARADRQYGPLLELEVAADINAEAITASVAARATAYSARCEDDEAAGLLDRILADDQVTPDEVPLLKRALKHIRRSAAHDHQLAESL